VATSVVATDAVCAIDSEASLLEVRAGVRAAAASIGFGLVEQTKVVTAASELARNILRYAGRGCMVIERVRAGSRVGLRARFEDEGPGIDDVELALQDGFSSGDSLGLGLPGAKRLVDDLQIDSVPGRGTVVVATMWVP